MTTPSPLDAAFAWHRLGDFPHFHYTILAVDEARQITDFIIRYDSDAPIFLHRHRSETHTLVLQGEHRLYAPDGALTDTRPTGRHSITAADADPHSEGGGPDGALVLYSTRGSADGVLFDVLDADGHTVATLSLADVAGLLAQQDRPAGQ